MKYENIVKHYNEVIKQSPVYNLPYACNNSDLLLPEFYQLIQKLIDNYLIDHETKPFILETYRSNELQLKYFQRGVSKIKRDGMHHYGIAVDLVAKNENKIDYEKLDYEWLRKEAKELGLTVLDWELCHFQFIPVSEQQTLRNEINNS